MNTGHGHARMSEARLADMESRPTDATDTLDLLCEVRRAREAEAALKQPPRLTLASLQKMIQNDLAYPFAWEKFGLGEAKVEAVAAYCRDRSAHLAQVIWEMFESSRSCRDPSLEEALNSGDGSYKP